MLICEYRYANFSPALQISPAPQTDSRVAPHPQVYCWGGGVASVPSTLPGASDNKIASVAAGRTQRAGVTEGGKLIFWEVGSHGYFSW